MRDPLDAETSLAETTDLWHRWSNRCRNDDRWRAPVVRRMLGNFPQALTHMAIVNTARLASIPTHDSKSASLRGIRPAAAAAAST
jgi:GH15 family glucan-1,4-alpha-glucosidase